MLSCLRLDMAKTICKRRCLSFYFSKNTFDSIPISVCEYLKSVVIFSQDWSEVVGIINEKLHVVKLITTV